jgi:hypothetical protein
VADARAAKAQGQRYLVGVYGYVAVAPGATDRTLPIRYIEETSDYSGCPGLNRRAQDYALRFNAEMQTPAP